MPVAVGSVRLVRLRPLGEQAEAKLIAHGQLLRGLLDLLICILPLSLLEGFDELVHLALRFLLLRLGQEHPRFDIHEIGRHGDKLAGNFHIHALHFVQIRQILLQNSGDLDILYFNFILAQQQQDHVQRAVEVLERLALRVHDAAEMVSRFIHADITPKNKFSAAQAAAAPAMCRWLPAHSAARHARIPAAHRVRRSGAGASEAPCRSAHSA